MTSVATADRTAQQIISKGVICRNKDWMKKRCSVHRLQLWSDETVAHAGAWTALLPWRSPICYRKSQLDKWIEKQSRDPWQGEGGDTE